MWMDFGARDSLSERLCYFWIAATTQHCRRKQMRVLSYEEVREKGARFSKVHLWRMEKDGRFPKRVALGPAKHGWIDTEIDQWIADRAAARDVEAA
jgi:prophage regulatory protein